MGKMRLKVNAFSKQIIKTYRVDEIPEWHVNPPPYEVDAKPVLNHLKPLALLLIKSKTKEAYEVLAKTYHRKALLDRPDIAFDKKYVRGIKFLMRLSRVMQHSSSPDRKIDLLFGRLMKLATKNQNTSFKELLFSAAEFKMREEGGSMEKFLKSPDYQDKVLSQHMPDILNNISYRYKPFIYWEESDKRKSIDDIISDVNLCCTVNFFVCASEILNGEVVTTADLKETFGKFPSEHDIWRARDLGVFHLEDSYEYKERNGIISKNVLHEMKFSFDEYMISLFKEAQAKASATNLVDKVEMTSPVKKLKKSKPTSVVYAVVDGLGHVKIGYTNDVKSRLIGLQSGNAVELKVFAVIPGDLELEKALHQRFKHHHIRGEWFAHHEEIIEYFKGDIRKTPNDS